MKIKTIRGYYKSFNVFITDSGNELKVSPITYLTEIIDYNIPCYAYINYYYNEVEVLYSGVYPGVSISNVIIGVLFTDEEYTPLEIQYKDEIGG